MFKSYCDQSQWKAWQCVSFLAKANGCADPRLINPGPEGDDMPCPANARVDKWTKMKAAWVEQCKKRQWIMMPTRDGSSPASLRTSRGSTLRSLIPAIIPRQCRDRTTHRSDAEYRPVPARSQARSAPTGVLIPGRLAD